MPDPLLACLDGVSDGVIITDLQGQILHWNPAALRLHGYTSAEQLRRHVSDFQSTFVLQSPDGKPVPFDQWPIPRLLRGEKVENLEVRLQRTDTGECRVVEYHGTRVDTGATGPQIVLTLHDLTQRRQAEEKLLRSQAELRNLIESRPQLVWTCRGGDGSCDYVSPQYVAFTGAPYEHHLGAGWMTLLHPDDREAVKLSWEQTSVEPKLYEAQCRLRRSDGAYRWFKLRATPICDSAGRVTQWFGTSTDMHAEQQAAEWQAVLAAIVEHSDDAIVGKSLDGVITSWNLAAERMFGYCAAEAIGQKVLLLLPRDRVDEEQNILEKLRRGEAIEHFESQRVTKDGRRIDVSLTISPIRDSSGVVVGASKIARDITGRRLAEAERELAEQRAREQQAALAHLDRVRTVGQMAAGLAHELNQPFAAIANYANACRRLQNGHRLSSERLIASLTDIEHEAARAGAIVHRLRGFVQKQQSQARPVNVNDSVYDAVHLLSFDLRQAAGEMRLNLDDNLPLVLADAVQIGQVLVNLIRNSIDAAIGLPPERRTITVASSSSDGQVRVTVSDQGCGISPQELPHVFDAFFTTKPDGLGIGLALCRSILEEHGGTLSAELNPTCGMTFVFNLRAVR